MILLEFHNKLIKNEIKSEVPEQRLPHTTRIQGSFGLGHFIALFYSCTIRDLWPAGLIEHVFFENVLKFVGFQTMLMLDLYCMTYTECMVWYDLNNAEVCSLHSETCLYIQIQLRMLWFCIYFFMEKKSCFPFHYHFANSHENIYITRVVRPSHNIL